MKDDKETLMPENLCIAVYNENRKYQAVKFREKNRVSKQIALIPICKMHLDACGLAIQCRGLPRGVHRHAEVINLCYI